MKTTKSTLLVILLVSLAIFGYVRSKEQTEANLLNKGLEVFNTYLEVTKEKDLDGLKGLAYQLSETCSNEETREECDGLMLGAHDFGLEMKQEKLRVFGYDSKQLILASEYEENSDAGIPANLRGIIYFIREGKELKLLSFNPFDGAVIFSGEEATSTISTRLNDMVMDTDKDGLADMIETCSDEPTDEECMPTDPNKKDTNDDGFWDSIEKFIAR